MPTHAPAYLDPATIASVGSIDLRARMIVEGLMTGMHRSPMQGFSVEFAQHRQYTPGDDTRFLDWKVFGRTDKLYIKRYQQETNLDVVVLVDASASMTYGTLPIQKGWGGTASSERRRRWTKFDHATALSAAIAYLCLHQQDRVGVCVFADELKTIVERSGTRGQWRKIVTALAAAPTHQQTNIVKSCEQVLGKVTNRALFVIVSDFFEDAASTREALARFRHKRHDVILIHALDRQEMRFGFDEPAPFEGLEAEGMLRIEPRALRRAYLDALSAHSAELARTSRGFGFDYLRIDTHESVGPPLSYLLARRNAYIKRSKVG
jgi:uncharacterized protein (DUF58 family)